MNSTVVLAKQCPFHAQIKETGKNFDMFEEAYQTDPANSLREFRDQLPIFYSETMGYWIVTRYDDVKAIFRDPIVFSACNALEKLTPSCPASLKILEKYEYGMNRTLVNEDEPVHMERRRVLMDAFTPHNLEVHQQFVKNLVKKKVDGFIHKGTANLVQEMLWEVPLTVALHFLGVPEDDMDELRKFAVAHTVNTWGRPSLEEQLEVAEGVGQFWQYSGHVLEKMKNNPNGEGWMYDMIAKNRQLPEVVTDNYLHSMMMAIMVAAHETTALASVNALKLLLTNRQIWKKICENPALIPGAVEECLRHSGSVVAWRRQATQDIELNGIQFHKGDKLFLVSASANHDEMHFENADEFDIYRDNAIEHLTFGYGAHQCMGKNIGRMEMCIFIEELSRRIPDLTLSEQTFSYLANTSFRGPEALWVEWDVKQHHKNHQAISFPIGAPDSKAMTRPISIKSIAVEAEDVLRIELSAVNGDVLPKWSAGAHIELVLSNGMSRKYSLCGDANDPFYTIAVKQERNGRGGSAWIHQHLKESDIVQIKGPKNFFKLNLNATEHVLIAGGIGITPILSMANTLRAQSKPYRIVYLARHRHQMALLDEVLAHGERAELFISVEGNKLDIQELLSHLPDGTQVCACGSEKLLDALTTYDEQFPSIQITIEHFNAGQNSLLKADDVAFDVELIDSGLTLTVPKNQTLLECLLEKGFDVPNDCCEGLCGSCQLGIDDGEIDHRDKVMTKTERDSMKLMISCCSRGKGKLKIKL